TLLRTSDLLEAAGRILDLDGDQLFGAGNRDVPVACASTRALRAHGVVAGGTDADVGAGEFEFLLGTIAADSPGADGRRHARDGTRARRHSGLADRIERAVAGIPAAA